jgi:hypothetical protein
MENVCDNFKYNNEQVACRQGAANAHLGRNEYVSLQTVEEEKAYNEGFYSTFACPLRYTTEMYNY